MVKKILFPTDYSPASNAALRYAVSLARPAGATLIVAHIEPPSVPPLAEVGPPTVDTDQEEAGLLELLTTVTREGQEPVAHEFRKLRGDPAAEILRMALAEQIDLIVMATAGRSGWRRFLMGSVAEAVIRQATCPVLSLKLPLDAELSVFDTPAPAIEPVEFRAVDDAGAKLDRSNAVELLRRAVAARATDVHFDPIDDGSEVRFRVDGRLDHFCRLHREVAQPLVAQLKILAELDIADPFRPQEGRLSLDSATGGYEVRITKVPVVGGESVALRLLDRGQLLRSLDSLGLTAEPLGWLRQMLRLGEGVVLVTGPAGSGKTTTAYSMVYTLADGHRNIVTMEDPVEYQLPGLRQMAVDPRHGVTMTSGLKTLLRMDPDIVLVGEIRDAETAEIAMRAASSGKYVFTTLHTRDVASTITALRDLHIDNRSLAGNLTGIISQRLVRRLCPHCRKQVPLSEADRQIFLDAGLEPPESHYQAVGCPQCRHRGYFERVGVFEVALPNRAIRQAIERGCSEEELRDLLRSNGTRSLQAAGLAKVVDGTTSLDEVHAMTWVHFPGPGA